MINIVQIFDKDKPKLVKWELVQEFFVLLNKDQLNGLAELCFDLAKAAFILALFSPLGSKAGIYVLFDGVKGRILGLALVYFALLLLKIKGGVKK